MPVSTNALTPNCILSGVQPNWILRCLLSLQLPRIGSF
jgi:hypothetical protein